jgi:hypothetical protein
MGARPKAASLAPARAFDWERLALTEAQVLDPDFSLAIIDNTTAGPGSFIGRTFYRPRIIARPGTGVSRGQNQFAEHSFRLRC